MYQWSFWRMALFVGSVLPSIYFAWGIYTDSLGGNPIEYATHQTGQLSLFFLGVTLMIRPAQEVFGFFQIMQYRRQLGLFAFYYAALHAVIYFGVDLGFYWQEIWIDLLEHPYVWVGMIAVLIMLLLAVTSTQGLRRKLKKTWQKIHNWIYIVPVLGVVHFLLLVKADLVEPILYAIVFIALLSWRMISLKKRRTLSIFYAKD